MFWPLREPVPTSTKHRTSSGACSVISWATKPPIENPSTSTCFNPSALMKAMALAPISSNVVGTSPELLETPALLNRITSRSLARPSVTTGSQWSIVPVKCWLKTSGTPPALPKRRYAKRTPLASTNCVGAVWWVCALMSRRPHAVERRLLAGALAAVGVKDLAGYERSVVGTEEDDGAGDLVGFADAPERHCLHERCFSVRSSRKPVEHAGLRRARNPGVDAHALTCCFERCEFCHAFHGVLARDIDRGSG